jgi:hypothetical protein
MKKYVVFLSSESLARIQDLQVQMGFGEKHLSEVVQQSLQAYDALVSQTYQGAEVRFRNVVTQKVVPLDIRKLDPELAFHDARDEPKVTRADGMQEKRFGAVTFALPPVLEKRLLQIADMAGVREGTPEERIADAVCNAFQVMELIANTIKPGRESGWRMEMRLPGKTDFWRLEVFERPERGEGRGGGR